MAGGETLGRDTFVSPGDVTLRSYEQGAALYRNACRASAPAYTTFLNDFAGLVVHGDVLEIGSGTGRDAVSLGQRGLRVVPTDGASSFVEMMISQGLPARRLDIRTDDLGGPYGAVLANAVLLHLSRSELPVILARLARSVAPGGVGAFTFKEGDGEGWSVEKLGLPRHFTYWREPELKAALVGSGWIVEEVRHADGQREPWLLVLATTPAESSGSIDTPSEESRP